MTFTPEQLKAINNVLDAALKNAGTAIFGDALVTSIACGLLKTTPAPVAPSATEDQAVS